MNLDDEEEWDAWLAALKAWLSARPATGSGWAPDDTRLGRLKIAVYHLVRDCRAEKKLGVLRRYIIKDVSRPREITFKENPYYWVFWFLLHNGEIGLTKEQISPFSRQLKYADLNDVDPELLIGFLYQQGSYRALSKKLNLKQKEPWFRLYSRRRKQLN